MRAREGEPAAEIIARPQVCVSRLSFWRNIIKRQRLCKEKQMGESGRKTNMAAKRDALSLSPPLSFAPYCELE